jgi:hypothetical protein
MQSWRSGSANVRLCSGRLLRRALCVAFLSSTLTLAQNMHREPLAKRASSHAANEFTLAGVRPGKDTVSHAIALNKKPNDTTPSGESQLSWFDPCNHQRMILDYDASRKVQVIRVLWVPESEPTTCHPVPPPSHWSTGLGLRIYDSDRKLVQLYGQPDSKSPSTRDGQPLELWYYAFDWAGPDVPQVMEVLCTRETDGKPGKVVEITLAAPSL